MQYHVLATDFDGTLAEHGIVPESTYEALRKVKSSGRKLILITGRRLEPIFELVTDIDLFDLIVAENGVVLYTPETRDEKLLAPAPPAALLSSLRQRGVDRLESGRVIVATWRPFETIALDVISELAIDLQIIFNKDAVMLLPSGCNKAFGLKAALTQLGISPLNTVCIGDAENDEAMMRMVGFSVAVANALQPVKRLCSYVTSSPRGKGVEELCEHLLADDLSSLSQRDNFVTIGEKLDGTNFSIPISGCNVLVTGGPGGGKSKFATHFLEQLSAIGAQCCVIDPEGDYQGVAESITLGSAERAPAVDEVLNLIESETKHCIVSLFAVEKKERPEYFNRLLRALAELRSRTARPHWIIVDEAHYAAPTASHFAERWNQDELRSILFITAFDEHVSKSVLRRMDYVISISDHPRKEIDDLARELEAQLPAEASTIDTEGHKAIAWNRKTDELFWFHRLQAKERGQRHRHSLLEGDMDEHLQFVFRGPDCKLQLKAANLRRFIELAEGLDDETWLFHLRRSDYSTWLRDVIKDDELAMHAENVEHLEDDPRTSREKIIQLIKERFDAKW